MRQNLRWLNVMRPKYKAYNFKCFPCVFNQRLQLLHETVHGLVSERAIVRLVQFVQYFASHYGTEPSSQGQRLKVNLSYYQIARSVSITYQECVRLFKSIPLVVSYSRGGKITILDFEALNAIASGRQ